MCLFFAQNFNFAKHSVILSAKVKVIDNCNFGQCTSFSQIPKIFLLLCYSPDSQLHVSCTRELRVTILPPDSSLLVPSKRIL